MSAKTLTLLAIWAVAFATGLLDGLYGGHTAAAGVLLIGPGMLQAMLAFFWVHYDAAERGLWPSRLLKLAVAGLALLAVPWYLLRTRPPGARLKALGGFVLVGLAYLLSSSAGVFCASLLRG